MRKTILTFAAAAAFSSVIGTGVSAQDVKVRNGDTLWGIAQAHEVTVEDIKTWNDLDSDIILPQEVLKISKEKYHTVQSGDTLWGVSKAYGVSVNELKIWNKLQTDMIHPDQQLVILTGNNTDKGDSVQTTASPSQKESSSIEKTKTETSESKELTMTATGYTASCEGCSGVTATGVDLKANPNSKVISVDPSVIPLGSKVYVEGYGYATASDTGGAIKGNKIDVFIPNHQDAINWGVKTVKVKILD